jgi:hypothetical protein
MEFGEALLEFSKGTFFHNVLDGFFFCTAFTRRVLLRGLMYDHIRTIVRRLVRANDGSAWGRERDLVT